MKLIEAVSLKRLVVYPVLLIALLAETGFSTPALFGVTVSIVYPSLLAASFVLDEKEIAVAGLVLGIAIDFQSLHVGLNAVFFAITLYFIAVSLKTFLNRNIATFSVVSAIAVTLYETVCFIFYLAVKGKIPFFEGLLKITAPKALLAFGVAMLCYGIFAFFRYRFSKQWDKSK
ncbi:MAG: hypothetical protein II808_04015 [Clostridia bacterium]|nr:hypothetical protein [Clostridia bacterium]